MLRIFLILFLISTGPIRAGRERKIGECKSHPRLMYWSVDEKFYFKDGESWCRMYKGEIPSFTSQDGFKLLKNQALLAEADSPFFVTWEHTNRSEPVGSPAILSHKTCYVMNPRNSTLTLCQNSESARLLCFVTELPSFCKQEGDGGQENNGVGVTSLSLNFCSIFTTVLSICFLNILQINF